MLRRWHWVSLAVLLLLAAVGVQPAVAQEKSYHAERFDVAVTVAEGGDLTVVETIDFVFEGEPFTFVFRELEPDRSDGIREIEAYLDGRRLPEGDAAGQVEIEGRDPIRITWHFEPLLGAHVFELRYRQLGVVQRTAQGDLLRYQPLPDEYEYTIDASRIEISYPAAAEAVGAAAITDGRGELATAPGRIIITGSNLGPDDTLVVEQTFAEGSLIAAPPAWQQRRAEQNALGPLWTGAAVLLIAVTVGAALYMRPRTPQPLSMTDQPRFAPPDDLPPGLAGALNGTEPAWSNALATLFDLAERNVVVINQIERPRWQGKDFEIILLKQPADLRPHEAALLEMLFAEGKGADGSINFSELTSAAGGKGWKLYSEAVKAEMMAAGLWDKAGDAPRRRLMGYGVILLLLALAVFLVSIVRLVDVYGGWPLLLAVGLCVGALTAFIVGASIKPLTARGAQQAAEWQRFHDYLRGVTRGQQAVSSPDMFQRYLTYATSYGLLTNWVRHFERTGWNSPPAWFRALPDSSGSEMAIFVVLANNASSSGAAGGAAAGAAGGGGSGAG